MRAPELIPNPENATPEDLRVAMEAAPNKRSYIRLNAIRSLFLGLSKSHSLPAFLPNRPYGPPVD